MKFVLDAMGGDLAPKVNTDGAVDFLAEHKDVVLVLAGPEETVRKSVESYADQAKLQQVVQRIEYLDAPEVITTEEHPVNALRRKKRSGIVLGMEMVHDGQADGFVSAGSTGAIMFGGMAKVKMIKGIARPALGALLPVPKRPMLLVDSGANVDCKPEWIEQFAVMGSIYMNRVLHVEKPEVGLLNIGTEEAKGNQQTQAAYALLARQPSICFSGNVEARDALSAKCDVLTADGFAANILLKTVEGTMSTLFGMLKEAMMSTTKGKIAGLLCKDTFRQLKHSFDASEAGGAPLLGVEGIVIKAHGNSNARAIFCALRQAYEMQKADIVGQIRAGLGESVFKEEREETK